MGIRLAAGTMGGAARAETKPVRKLRRSSILLSLHERQTATLKAIIAMIIDQSTTLPACCIQVFRSFQGHMISHPS
jgi:hypothetical protein